MSSRELVQLVALQYAPSYWGGPFLGQTMTIIKEYTLDELREEIRQEELNNG